MMMMIIISFIIAVCHCNCLQLNEFSPTPSARTVTPRLLPVSVRAKARRSFSLPPTHPTLVQQSSSITMYQGNTPCHVGSYPSLMSPYDKERVVFLGRRSLGTCQFTGKIGRTQASANTAGARSPTGRICRTYRPMKETF